MWKWNCKVTCTEEATKMAAKYLEKTKCVSNIYNIYNVYIYIYMYIYVYVYIYIYIYIYVYIIYLYIYYIFIYTKNWIPFILLGSWQ